MYCITKVKESILSRYMEPLFRECKGCESMMMADQVFDDFVKRLRHAITHNEHSAIHDITVQVISDGNSGRIEVSRQYTKRQYSRRLFFTVSFIRIVGRAELSPQHFKLRITKFIEGMM